MELLLAMGYAHLNEAWNSHFNNAPVASPKEARPRREYPQEVLGLDLSKPGHTVSRGGAVVDVHHWRGRRIVWAPHPAARIAPEEWVDAVVEAVIMP